MTPLDLIGRVAARRLRDMTEVNEGRAYICMLGLESDVVSAIARHVAQETAPGRTVEAFVHPQLADGVLGGAQISDKPAPWHRNHGRADVRLTLCTVPSDREKQTLPTLGHNEKLDDAWLLQEASVWTQEALTSSTQTIRDLVEVALQGVLLAGVAHDAMTVARFVVAVNDKLVGAGMTPERAIRAAMPQLKLPRDSGDPGAKITASVAEAARFFAKASEEHQPALYLKAQNGDPLNPDQLKQRLDVKTAENEIDAVTAAALRALISDRMVIDGSWTATQAAVAELGWEKIEPFFNELKRKIKPSFGEETLALFDRQFPTALEDDDKALLTDLAGENRKPNVQLDAFFTEHRERLKTEPRLYKRWERLVFQAAIETDDLAEGLLRLAHRAVPETDGDDDDGAERALIIRLRGSEKLDFWTREKNSRVLRYIRDRYRGLAALLEPHVLLDFGRCWTEDWGSYVKDDVVSRSRVATELAFEAYLVPREEAAVIAADKDGRPHPNRAQLIWRAPAEAIGLSLGHDLRLIRRDDRTIPTRLLSGYARQNRAARANLAQGLDLSQRTSISDAQGQSEGYLANPASGDHHIDTIWPRALERIVADGILTSAAGAALQTAFEDFSRAYGEAIDDLLRGSGLASHNLLDQAEKFGALLAAVRKEAPQPVCIQELLSPLVSIGVIAIDGDRPAALVAPWQPMRLAEIAAKARQLARDIGRVVSSRPEQRADIHDFVNDRAARLRTTFYGDIAVLPGDSSQLLAETQVVADCSLVESVTDIAQHGIADEPADAAVAAFERVANEYLALHPHEQSNFSVVILNADSENLPLAMANKLARDIEDNPDLRCELVVTDEDPARLRQVYERQNRRISGEIDASLASDAARNFLSRLRLGIHSPEVLSRDPDLKATDIALLQDVIARHSDLRWMAAEVDPAPPSLAECTPSERSKRRPFRRGDTASALYLTAPRQPAATQAYVNALYTVMSQDVPTNDRLPVQEVEFRSGDVDRILKTAHQLGTWVMTFDRVADRRLVTRDDRRIIRYFSAPGSTHNVIVSAEITELDLFDHISSDLAVILPGVEPAPLAAVRTQIFERAVKLSGGVVMRGAQWGNYAHELLGLVLSQREIERMLTHDRESRTGWFFLDDYRDFLDLTGEMADILAIDFSEGADGPEIRLVVAEAKYCSRDTLPQHRKKSLGQLESTFTALSNRLMEGEASLAPTIWRNRLADMVLEHMEPFDQVGGLTQAAWLEALRNGQAPIRLEGYSLVFSHDQDAWHEALPVIPDEIRPLADRRRMAQWIFPRPVTAQALRDLGNNAAAPLLSRPLGWPSASNSTPSPEIDDAPDTPDTPSPPSPPPAGLGPGPNPGPEPDDGAESSASIETGEAEEEADAPTETAPAVADAISAAGPWSPEVSAVLTRLSRARNESEGEAWLESQIVALRSALQKEGMDAPVVESRLTPNTGLIYVGGVTLTVGWLEKKQTDLLTRYGLDIVRITPMANRIAIGLKRPKRAILHLADAWLRRTGDEASDAQKMAPLLGEKEDDGQLCFLPLASEFADQETAAPHSLISGTTGSGKGILVTNVILDLCALNGPSELELYLIDPKRGVDYAWARRLPQLKAGIIDDQAEALALLHRLVEEMDDRYDAIAAAACRNIAHYNRTVGPSLRMPRIVIVFDEVANWMQDDEFKSEVDGLINKIATKSRAAGFHLFMIYQRADAQVMTMQLRTNLGNKLILRLGDEGSSRIALGDKGAERLLGKGHLIAKLGTDERIYMQVPYIGDEEVDELAAAVIASWSDRA